MAVVEAFAFEFGAAGEVGGFAVPAPEPGEVFLGSLWFFASVFVPFDFRVHSQDASSFDFDIGDGQEGADIHADSVVEVRLPADGLFMQRFPADEDVVRGFAFQNLFQFAF